MDKFYTKTKSEIENTCGKVKNLHDAKALSNILYILKQIYHYPTMRLDTLKELGGV